MNREGVLERFTVKEMEVQDLDEVLEIAASSSLHFWSKKMFIEEMSNPLAHCFIIKRNGAPDHPLIGFICFRNVEDESELLNICVHPRYRKMGFGKKLMEFYLRFCHKRKIRKFYLEVDASNHPAIYLYQSFFFDSVGIRKRFYQGKFDALLMSKKA